MKKELSDRFLKSLKAPESGRLEVSDTKRPGLRFRLSASGKATWMFEKRVKGGQKRKHTFGSWPFPVGLSEARAMALEIEAEAAKGIDRVLIAKEAKLAEEVARTQALSVGQVLNIYDRLHLSTLRRGAERYRQLEQALADHIDAPIDQLTRRSLQLAIDAKANDGRKVYANRIRAALSAFTAWAAGREYIDRDIGAALPKATKETARTRVLSIEEIRKIWDASHQMGVLWGPIIRLWILTAQRRGEILDLRWSEIDLDQRHILKPGSKTKNGKPHVTHLSPPAIKEFEALLEKNRVQKAARQPGKSAASEFVFTATGYSPPSGVSKAKARLDRILGENVEPWRLHDIRTAFATVMVSVDVPETVADRVLNHSASGSAPSAVARVYNQAELLPQRAAALEKWAEIVTGEGAQVISLRLKK